jgi:tRNA splicing ligase
MSGLRTPDADNVLIKELYALNKKSPKLVKPSVQHPKSDPEQAITTWKMSEFRYYDIPSPFPTLARGLFTRKDGECYEIVARGYDKFFNIGEVPWNTVRPNEHTCRYSVLLFFFISGQRWKDIPRHHTLSPLNQMDASSSSLLSTKRS